MSIRVSKKHKMKGLGKGRDVLFFFSPNPLSFILSLFLLICPLTRVPVVHARGIDEAVLMVDGKYRGPLEAYPKDGKLYVNAQQAMDLLGGKTYWYPVSGRLLLQVKGSQAKFLLRSEEITLENSKMRLSKPVISRAGKIFVTMEFLESRQFSGMLGRELSYNSTTHIISAEKRANVNHLTYFSYKDKTRVVLEVKGGIGYHYGLKGKKRLDILMPDGTLESPDRAEINDGVVREAALSQEKNTARLTLNLGDGAGKWNVFRLKEPDRIVIDVEAQSPRAAATGDLQAAESGKTVPAQQGAAVQPQSVAPAVTIPDAIVTERGARKRIVIDAGHGGKDSGGRKVFGLTEKEINLLLAKELSGLLKEDGKFDVLLTRTSDFFIPLAERSRIANDFKADIFISIHANASTNRRENGFEIYFMSENASDPWAAEVAAFENAVMDLEDKTGEDPAMMLLHSMARNEYINEASRLAAMMTRQLSKRVSIINRGVKQAAFYVLRGTYSPAVLVEAGFMTNSRDQGNLCSKAVRKKMAAGLYAGIVEYARSKEWK